MPSRKKAQGKARKAAKAKKEMELAELAATFATGFMQRVEESVKKTFEAQLNTEKCCHGNVPTMEKLHVAEDFLDIYMAAFRASEASGDENPYAEAFRISCLKYADVWMDPAKMEWVISFMLQCGTAFLLEGNIKSARVGASFICCFEEWITREKKIMNWAKWQELKYADEHSLVSFFRNRVPCSCLDEKYKEVKNITKLGICANLGDCSKGGMVPRSTMFYCTRCCNRCIVPVNARLIIGQTTRRTVPSLQII